MKLTQHIRQRMKERRIPMATVIGAVRQGKKYPGRNGTVKYCWQGAKVIMDGDVAVTVFDRLKGR